MALGRKQLALGAFLLGLGLTWGADQMRAERREAALLARLVPHAEQRLGADLQAVQRHLAILDVLAAYFRSQPESTSRHFQTFAAALQRLPGLDALFVAEGVPEENRAEFLARQQQFQPGFAILQRKADGSLAPANAGKLHIPVIYSASLNPQEKLLGLDLRTLPALKEVLQPGSKRDVLLVSPERAGNGPASLQLLQRRLIAGHDFYFGVRLSLSGLLESHPADPVLRDNWLDITDRNHNESLFPPDATQAQGLLLAQRDLPLGNRLLRVEYRLDPGARSLARKTGQIELWSGGLLASLLLGILIYRYRDSRRLRERQFLTEQNRELQTRLSVAQEAVSEVQRDNLRLTTILDTANEAVVMIDEKGCIEIFNTAAEQLFGFQSDELLGCDVSILMPTAYRHRHDDALHKYVSTGQSRVMGTNRELLGQRKDGSVFPLELSLNEFRLGDRRYFVSVIRDIADRKRAERMLFESEYKHRAILDAAFIGIYVQQDGRLRFVNPTFAAYFGRPGAEMLEKLSLEDLVSPTSLTALREALDVGSAGGRPTELLMERSDGSRFYALFTAKPIIFDNRPGVAGSLLDITERKAAAEAMLRAEIKNVAILDAIPDLMLQIDAAGMIIDSRVGAGGADFGVDSEVIGQHYRQALPADLARQLDGVLRKPSRERPRSFEYEATPADGNRHVFEARVTPMSEGEHLVMMRDISERKTIEAELIHHRDHLAELVRERTAELNSLFATSPLPTVLLSYRRVLEVNNAFVKLFGHGREMLIGNALDEVISDTAMQAATGRDVNAELARGEVVSLEQQLRQSDGSYVLCEVFGKAVNAADPQAGSIWVYQDISERRAAELALKEAKELAEAANAAKSEFLANMSHELRTPMHAVLSFAELGEVRARDAKDERLLRYFERIRQSGHRLLQMLNDLLDLSKLEAGKMEYRMQPLALQNVAAEVLEELGSLGRSRDIVLQADATDDLPLVDADPQRMAQVLRNLVANAIRFSPDRGQVRVTFSQDAAHVFMGVEDEGVGIPPDELERIFDKFIQSTKTKTGAGGTGLGLAISRQIVQAHAGTVHAENRPGGGARFVVTLPRALNEAQPT